MGGSGEYAAPQPASALASPPGVWCSLRIRRIASFCSSRLALQAAACPGSDSSPLHGTTAMGAANAPAVCACNVGKPTVSGRPSNCTGTGPSTARSSASNHFSSQQQSDALDCEPATHSNGCRPAADVHLPRGASECEADRDRRCVFRSVSTVATVACSLSLLTRCIVS
jgi:hypothetical protein